MSGICGRLGREGAGKGKRSELSLGSWIEGRVFEDVEGGRGAALVRVVTAIAVCTVH